MPSSGDLSFEVKCGFFTHVKTLRLKARLGLDGPWCLLRLWSYATQGFPGGTLTGHSPDEIEAVAGWQGERGAFHGALVDIAWLDDDGMTLHDWVAGQPYVIGRPARIAKARAAGIASGESRREKPVKRKRKSNPKMNPELNPEFNLIGDLVEPQAEPSVRPSERPSDRKAEKKKQVAAVVKILRQLTGSTPTACRDQVTALVNIGLSLPDLRVLAEEHGGTVANVWEWKKKVQALNGKLTDPRAKPDGFAALREKWRDDDSQTPDA